MEFLRKIRSIKLSGHAKTMLLALLTMMSLLAVFSVGPIYAYLKMNSNQVTNVFDASPSASPTVNINYSINVGDNSSGGEDTGYSVYVRAAVVVTWKNASGDVFGAVPDCTVPVSRYWAKSGAFYYYNTAVENNGTTEPLLTGDVTTTDTAPEGYHLAVDILVQTIQSEGETDGGVSAVENAWEHSFS